MKQNQALGIVFFVTCLFTFVLHSNNTLRAEEEPAVEVELTLTSEEDSLSIEEADVVAVLEQEEAEQEKQCESKTCSSETASTKTKSSSRSWFSKLFSSGEEESNTAADNSKFPATHRQVALLKVTPPGTENQEGKQKTKNSGWGVKSFCLDGKDNLLVASGDNESGQLQLLDSQGDRLQTWDLPIVPEAVNVDPAGNYLVAGAGKIFRLDTDGQVLLEAASPLIAQLEENKAEIREQVIQQIKDQAQMMGQQIGVFQQEIDKIDLKAARRLSSDDYKEFKLLRERIKKYEKADQEKLTVEEKNAWALRKVLLRMLQPKVEKQLKDEEVQMRDIYAQQLEYYEKYANVQNGEEPTDEQVDTTLASMIEYKSRIASVSATSDHVFIATGAVAGYGFDVWRLDAKLENPEKIVTSLRGCCGQMDVQACEGGLYVAENSGHQVRHFDLDGKKVNSWGRGAREGVRGFGSCCNPMNVAFGPDGSVYTAESESGRIKRYTPEGELIEHIGSVELVPGCKKVSVAITKDQGRVYMLDITRNHIIVMEPKPAEQQVVSKKTTDNKS